MRQQQYEDMVYHMASCVKNNEDMNFATVKDGESVEKTYDVEIVKEVLPTAVKNLTSDPTTRLLTCKELRNEMEKRAADKKEVYTK